MDSSISVSAESMLVMGLWDWAQGERILKVGQG